MSNGPLVVSHANCPFQATCCTLKRIVPLLYVYIHVDMIQFERNYPHAVGIEILQSSTNTARTEVHQSSAASVLLIELIMRHSQSTSSPDEDQQSAVETSRSPPM